jgi:hypothetical protein
MPFGFLTPKNYSSFQYCDDEGTRRRFYIERRHDHLGKDINVFILTCPYLEKNVSPRTVVTMNNHDKKKYIKADWSNTK